MSIPSKLPELFWMTDEFYEDSEMQLRVTPSDLSWSIDLNNPNHGGGCGLGRQSFEDFLRGEHPEAIPESQEAWLRAWLEAHLEPSPEGLILRDLPQD